MKLTGRQRIHLGALALAAGAFGADRAFFSPPVAHAKPPAATHVTPSAKKPAARAPAEELVDLSALCGRLKLAAANSSATEAGDGFQASRAWVERANPHGRTSTLTAAEQFRKRHRLLAVMSGQQAAWVIVDGKTLGIGQAVGGFRLIEVRERSAVFEAQEVHVELQLSK
ncbi:MAG TPA: hypothetical protein VFE47_22305 [Tepidisphaeraceae bacterium]|jgi:hypothetical protein|nr:hypothetical protein [Tepidisphaeraceae bacterium]